MTYHAPTETNPPFTTPPTWPYPTSSADWEPDYRLRLLEAAVIYLWSQGGVGPPGPAGPQGPAGPAGPATAGLYSAVGTAQPPTNGSTITPPAGFLWVDTSTSVVNPPYSPPFTPPPTGFNSVLDPTNVPWVSLNGSPWAQATQVLHGQWYRTAGWSTTTSFGNFGFDTVVNDVYGIANTGGGQFTVPLNGIWLFNSILTATSTANAILQTRYTVGGNPVATSSVGMPSAGFNIQAALSFAIKATAGTVFQFQELSNVILTGVPGNNITRMSLDYLGTG